MSTSLLEDIKKYLELKGVTTQIYKSQMPDPIPGVINEPIISIIEYGGDAPVWVQPQLAVANNSTPRYRQPRIQINARGNKEDYASASNLAGDVYEIIASIKNMTLNSGTFYQSVSPIQEPFLQRWDENRRPIFTFNAQVFLTHEQ